jgi:hypothetical protein
MVEMVLDWIVVGGEFNAQNLGYAGCGMSHKIALQIVLS